MKKSLIALCALFMFAGCSVADDKQGSTSGDNSGDINTKNFASYEFIRVSTADVSNPAYTEYNDYFSLNNPYSNTGSYVTTWSIKKATETFLCMHIVQEWNSGSDTIYTFTKSADEDVPEFLTSVYSEGLLAGSGTTACILKSRPLD